MLKYLGLPIQAATHAADLDRMLVLVHWLMLVLFVGWGAFFLFVLFRFRRSANPKASYVGAKGKFAKSTEVAVALIEALLLVMYALPAWAKRVTNLPSGNDGFTDLLFQHAIEGVYAVPEYGGNAGLVGWKEIGFPGDRQPKGFTADEVSRSDGRDPLEPTGIVADVLDLITATAPGAPSSTIVGPVRGR